jgi:opacity protein-like surface antigen
MNCLRRFSEFQHRHPSLWVAVVILAMVGRVAVCEEDTNGTKDASATETRRGGAGESTLPERELGFQGMGSVGHFHIFANSWWSNLYMGGAEYYRHSWGYAAGARLDYTAAVNAVVLRQPADASFWGNFPLSKPMPREYVGGLDIAPIGIRMQWFSNRAVKPYLVGRGGIMGTTKKALSVDGSYLNFSLQVNTGVQFRLSDRWDGRIGWGFFHFSNGFVVPSNPGLDSMGYTCGLSYHLGPRNRQ